MSFFADSGNWVALGLLAFIGVLCYAKVPSTIGAALDKRADEIKNELEEARKLREDAQGVLADYQRKAREAETEAQNIIAQAKREAEILAKESRANLTETLNRRMKAAEERIAQAEEQAAQDVRVAAVDAAIKASETILTKDATGKMGEDLIAESIKGLKARLN